jgi:hypothetical protein
VSEILASDQTSLQTDNEKTVTTGHVAGIPVRNRQAVTFGQYYGISVLTCRPADPASKGGVENAVRNALLFSESRAASQITPKIVTLDRCQYSLPSTLLGQGLGVRLHDGADEVIICALDDGGPIESHATVESVLLHLGEGYCRHSLASGRCFRRCHTSSD